MATTASARPSWLRTSDFRRHLTILLAGKAAKAALRSSRRSDAGSHLEDQPFGLEGRALSTTWEIAC